jgi:hypothetical protein
VSGRKDNAGTPRMLRLRREEVVPGTPRSGSKGAPPRSAAATGAFSFRRLVLVRSVIAHTP